MLCIFDVDALPRLIVVCSPQKYFSIPHELMPSSPFSPPNYGARLLQFVLFVDRMVRVGGIDCLMIVINQ